MLLHLSEVLTVPHIAQATGEVREPGEVVTKPLPFNTIMLPQFQQKFDVMPLPHIAQFDGILTVMVVFGAVNRGEVVVVGGAEVVVVGGVWLGIGAANEIRLSPHCGQLPSPPTKKVLLQLKQIP